MPLPIVFQYQQALDELKRGASVPETLLKRMSELISLIDLTTTLNSSLSSEEILDAALLIVMGQLQASRGVLWVRERDDSYQLRASRGLPKRLEGPIRVEDVQGILRRSTGDHPEVLERLGLALACPITKAGRTIALLGLGPPAARDGYATEEEAFVRGVAACAATPIENGRIYHELQQLNQRLSLKVFQLRNLFDISRELTASFDAESIQNLLATTLMGHLMVSRCALYVRDGEDLRLAHERGTRDINLEETHPHSTLEDRIGARPVVDLPPGGLRQALLRKRMALVVPLALGERPAGLLALGERVSGHEFTEEDVDFAATLGRQALAALESVRLHQVMIEKQRQDRDLQIAREIQQSLFPSQCPKIAGFEVAAESHSCYQVGGDHYDFIPLSGNRLALTVADVSGKGTPASILMASVHASLRALAGTTTPAALMHHLNRFLLDSTQANRYVTLFYGELDPLSRCLTYVNAGHVPPYRIGADGKGDRLRIGGPVLGLLSEVSFEVGRLQMNHGDMVAMFTDGATEALSPEDTEFGDDRVFDVLLQAAAGSAADAVRSLVCSVKDWAGSAGSSDDLTALILKAQ